MPFSVPLLLVLRPVPLFLARVFSSVPLSPACFALFLCSLSVCRSLFLFAVRVSFLSFTSRAFPLLFLCFLFGFPSRFLVCVPLFLCSASEFRFLLFGHFCQFFTSSFLFPIFFVPYSFFVCTPLFVFSFRVSIYVPYRQL